MQVVYCILNQLSAVPLLQSRLSCISASIQQQISPRNTLNQQQAFSHPVEHSDYHTRYSTQVTPVLDRLGSPQPLLGDPRLHPVLPPRNHPSVQHGSFAENDYHQQQESFFSPPSFSSPVDHFAEAQQRPPTEYPEKRRSPRIAQDRLNRRPLQRSPITTHRNLPPSQGQSPKVTGNSHSIKPTSGGSTFSQPINSKKSNSGSSWAKSASVDGEKSSYSNKAQGKVGTKSPIIADKKSNVVESAIAVTEKNVPSLFGPPPSKNATQRPKKAVTNDKKAVTSDVVITAIEPPTKPKPLMEITPVSAGLPFSTSLLSEESSQPSTDKKGMYSKSDTVHSKVVSSSVENAPIARKPVPLLDIKPVPLLDIKFDSKPVSTTTVKSVSKDLGHKSNQKSASPTVESKVTAKSITPNSNSSSTPKKETKSQEGLVSTIPNQTTTVEESIRSARPLWYANPDSICEQSDGEISGSADSAQQHTCESMELEEGEIAGESLSEEMDVVDHDETNPPACPTSTGISSDKILVEYFAKPEKFARFLPFQAEASEENMNTVEKCWHQLLILPSLTWKQKKNYWNKVIGRVKSHFAQRPSKPSFNFAHFCNKLWNSIANYLGTYLQRRLGDFVRGIIHRSMIDFTLIRMQRKKMPLSLTDLPMKSQINLLYIFNTQGFINATNNYMVKWLQDEVEKLDGRRGVTAVVMTAQVSDLTSKLNDELLEKRFCFAEYLNSKSFNNAEEDENCSRMCSLLKCKDFMPGTEWNYGVRADDTEASSGNQVTVEENKPMKVLDSSEQNSSKSSQQISSDNRYSEILYKDSKVIVPKNIKLQDVHIKLQVLGDKASTGEAKKKALHQVTQTQVKSNDKTTSSQSSSNSGIQHNTDCDSVHIKPVTKPEQTPAPFTEPKTVESPQSSNTFVQDSVKPADSVIDQAKPDATDMLESEPEVVVVPQDSDSKEKEKQKVDDDTTKAEITAKKSVTPMPEITVTPIPEITVTSTDNGDKLASTSSSSEQQQTTGIGNDKKPEEKQGTTTKKLHLSNAGKWRSYTSDGNSSSSSRPVSRRQRASRSRRAHNRSGDMRRDSRKLSGNGDDQSRISDNDKSAGSGSDSEDLEMMMLRKKALLSMLKASEARKTKTITESDKKEVQESETTKLDSQTQQNTLTPPADQLAVEQISDTESTASPVAHSHLITESDVVLVSLGPDNVVSFPSQYNSSTPQSSSARVNGNTTIPDAATAVKQSEDVKQDNTQVTPSVTSEVVGPTSAYYKVKHTALLFF